MSGLKLLLCTLATLVCTSESARILGVFPVPTKSHMIIMRALMYGLADRGHQITMVTPFSADEPHPNITEIIIKEVKFKIDPTQLFKTALNPVLIPIGSIPVAVSQTDESLAQPAFQKLIQAKDEHFDLVVVEAFFVEAFVGFAYKFKAPLIQVCPAIGMHWMYEWVGSPASPSYIPVSLLHVSSRMTFLERVANTAMMMYWELTRNLLYLPRQEAVMRKHFQPHVGEMPSLNDQLRSTSLMLANTHFSLSYPRPLTPNYVHVGGIHVKAPKQLPQYLQSFLDDAKDGAIFFSMGSLLRSVDMPEEIRKEILTAFSRLKYRILWKWEESVLPGLSDNVKVDKWLPQSDILAHPNIRLFITHGGGLSTQEAVVRGVPVMGIPILAEHKTNMMTVTMSGVGVKLDFNNITAKSLLWAINEALHPQYRESAQRLSQLFKDQPMTPLETAVFWTEYVIRHKGAPHMRSAALDLYWFQYLLLDVIGFLAIVAILAMLITFLIFRAVFRKLCARKTQSKQKKQ